MPPELSPPHNVKIVCTVRYILASRCCQTRTQQTQGTFLRMCMVGDRVVRCRSAGGVHAPFPLYSLHASIRCSVQCSLGSMRDGLVCTVICWGVSSCGRAWVECVGMGGSTVGVRTRARRGREQ